MTAPCCPAESRPREAQSRALRTRAPCKLQLDPRAIRRAALGEASLRMEEASFRMALRALEAHSLAGARQGLAQATGVARQTPRARAAPSSWRRGQARPPPGPALAASRTRVPAAAQVIQDTPDGLMHLLGRCISEKITGSMSKVSLGVLAARRHPVVLLCPRCQARRRHTVALLCPRCQARQQHTVALLFPLCQVRHMVALLCPGRQVGRRYTVALQCL